MKTVINIKTDQEVKNSAQKIVSDLGLSLSAVINAYLKQLVRSKTVYFSTLPQPTPELEALIKQAEEDYKKKRNISPIFSDPDDMLRYLHSK